MLLATWEGTSHLACIVLQSSDVNLSSISRNLTKPVIWLSSSWRMVPWQSCTLHEVKSSALPVKKFFRRCDSSVEDTGTLSWCWTVARRSSTTACWYSSHLWMLRNFLSCLCQGNIEHDHPSWTERLHLETAPRLLPYWWPCLGFSVPVDGWHTEKQLLQELHSPHPSSGCYVSLRLL